MNTDNSNQYVDTCDNCVKEHNECVECVEDGDSGYCYNCYQPMPHRCNVDGCIDYTGDSKCDYCQKTVPYNCEKFGCVGNVHKSNYCLHCNRMMPDVSKIILEKIKKEQEEKRQNYCKEYGCSEDGDTGYCRYCEESLGFFGR